MESRKRRATARSWEVDWDGAGADDAEGPALKRRREGGEDERAAWRRLLWDAAAVVDDERGVGGTATSTWEVKNGVVDDGAALHAFLGL